jgi:LPXTG-motif cell wall-anchored protein
MLKKTLIILFLLYLTPSISAVNVSVSVNGTVFSLGETVMLHLEVNTTEPIGGQFVLYQEVEPKKYVLVRIYADFPDCAACGGALPLSRPHSANYLFKPLSEGTYMAEAAFGGKASRVFFNVSRRTTKTVTTTLSCPVSPTWHTCKDSDGVDEHVRGRVLNTLGCKEYVYNDSCKNNGTVLEYFCFNDFAHYPDMMEINCSKDEICAEGACVPVENLTSLPQMTTSTVPENKQQPAQDNSLIYVGLLLLLAVAFWLLFRKRK